ncbi:MAG: class I SAM-dependent methyltransferase [Planctomycetota bacterium]
MPTQSLQIAGRPFQLQLPDPTHMLDQAVTGEAQGRDGWDPYWGLLWAAAPLTAQLILQAPPRSQRALELGCGVGLTGIAALAAGLNVTFSDQSAEAVQLALSNAAMNGHPDSKGLVFGWHQPPADFAPCDFLFGSDILYDRKAHAPLLLTLKQLLTPGGIVWIGDAGRANAGAFTDAAAAAGWSVRLYDHRLLPIRQPQHLQFRLLVLEHEE